MNYLNENNGIISTADIIKLNIDKKYLSILTEKKIIERTSRGIYVLPSVLEDEFYSISIRCKKGIFSHDTALFFHDLSDRTPLTFSLTGDGRPYQTNGSPPPPPLRRTAAFSQATTRAPDSAAFMAAKEPATPHPITKTSASTTLSATPNTAFLAKPTIMVFSGESSVKPGAASAASMTGVKSLSGICVTPGHATSPVVKIRPL